MSTDKKQETIKQQSAWNRFMDMSGSGVLIALVVWILFLVLFAPLINGVHFDLASNIVSVFKQEAYIGVIACGMTLVMITGNIDLSVGSMLTLMSCIVPDLVNNFGFFGALIGAILIGAALGLVNGVLVSGCKLNAFITTIAMSSIYGSLAIIYSNGAYKNVELITGSATQKAFNFIGQGWIGPIPMPVIILAIVVVILAFILMRTVFGQRLYAVGANLTAARFSGVRARLDVAITYVLTGALVGLAALMMISNVGSSNVQATSGKEMDIVLAVVLGGTSILGGKGTIVGTVIGFAFMGFLTNGFTTLGMNQYWQWVIEGIILAVALSMDVLRGKGVKLWKRK